MRKARVGRLGSEEAGWNPGRIRENLNKFVPKFPIQQKKLTIYRAGASDLPESPLVPLSYIKTFFILENEKIIDAYHYKCIFKSLEPLNKVEDEITLVFFNSDLSTVENLALADLSMRVIQIDPSTGKCRYYKNAVDIELLPVKKECVFKYSHNMEAWNSRINKIAEKFDIPSETLENGTKVLVQACAFDNCTTARGTGLKTWKVAKWCECHRISTSYDKTKEKVLKSNPVYKQQCELKDEATKAMCYTSESFARKADTRTWRAENRQDNDLVKKWDIVVKVTEYNKKSMPLKEFVLDHKEVTDVAGICFDRLEKLSALSLESVNCYLLLQDVCDSSCNTTCFREFKKELKKDLKTRVLKDCIDDHSLFAKACEPVLSSLNFEAMAVIETQLNTDYGTIVKNYFLDGKWRELIWCDGDLPIIQTILDDEEKEQENLLFGITSAKTLPTAKRVKQSIKQQQNQAMFNKYLAYRRYAVKNPIIDIDTENCRNYADNILGYLSAYLAQDYHFGRFLLRVMGLPVASATSETTFSVIACNTKVNSKLETINARCKSAGAKNLLLKK